MNVGGVFQVSHNRYLSAWAEPCRHLLELSEAETATMLDIPRGSAKSRLSRALGRMRAMMTEDMRR